MGHIMTRIIGKYLRHILGLTVKLYRGVKMNYLKKLSFWLLLSYVIYCIVIQPNVAQALIVGFLAGLFGWDSYLDSKKSYVIEPDEDIIKLKKELDKENLQLRIHQTQREYHKRSVNDIVDGVKNGSVRF